MRIDASENNTSYLPEENAKNEHKEVNKDALSSKNQKTANYPATPMKPTEDIRLPKTWSILVTAPTIS